MTTISASSIASGRLISKSNPAIEVFRYQNMPHGVLELSFPKYTMPQTAIFYQKNIEMIRECFEEDSKLRVVAVDNVDLRQTWSK